MWLTAVDIHKYIVKTGGPLIHGSPHGARRTVLEETDGRFYQVKRAYSLEREFRKALLLGFGTQKRVVVVIAAHGSNENGGCIVIGGKKFLKTEFEKFVPSNATGVNVSVLNTSCYSGLWLSNRFTTYAASTPADHSLSFSRSNSQRFRGGPWAACVDETLRTLGGETNPGEFRKIIAQRTCEVKSVHPSPTHRIAQWDKTATMAQILEYPHLGDLTVEIVHRDSGYSQATASSGPSKKEELEEHQDPQLQGLVEWYRDGENPHPDAPISHRVERLLYIYQNKEATPRDVERLKNILEGRRRDESRATHLLTELGVCPAISVRDWPVAESWNSHPLANILLEHWESPSNGIPYRKPLLYVVAMAVGHSISAGALKNACLEAGRVAKGARRRRHLGRK